MFRNIARHALIPTWRRSVAIKAHVPLVRMRVMRPFIRPFHMSTLSLNQNYSITDLTTERYHRLSDELLEHMCMKLEELADETDMKGFDVEYNQGVMTISVGDHGTYVINKQPPNHQIWLSSPVSGPQRYDFDEKNHKWFYHRDHHTLDDVLNSELSKAMGEKIDLLEGFEPQEK